ncbi:MAG: LysM peptidoglycan-binding domain-containing protein [Saprospiraceae bacterium]|nr:LysM peptidoglycan-binding domain-containing protein [Saprospiraceae bacterium]
MITKIVQIHKLVKLYKGTILLFSICTTCLNAQIPGNRFFYSGSEIVVDVLPGNDIFYSHSYDKGTSIYSLAEVFQTDAEKIIKLNKLNPKLPINDGKIVKVPIQKDKIVVNPNFKTDRHNHLALTYVVKKGESLFKISKSYFGSDVESLKKLNRKASEEIKVNEKLLIGFLLLSEVKKHSSIISPSKIAIKIKPIKTDQILIKEKSELKTKETQKSESLLDETINWTTLNVISMWDKKQVDSPNSYYVLNNEAKIGSNMEIYFPMMKRRLKAKVLGRIPEGMYHDDIGLFVSPAVAKYLGVLDSRFTANIKFEN